MTNGMAASSVHNSGLFLVCGSFTCIFYFKKTSRQLYSYKYDYSEDLSGHAARMLNSF